MPSDPAEASSKRVLHVIDSLIASGGAEQGLVREISRFDRFDEHRVVLLYDITELADRVPDIDIHVVGLPEGTGSRSWVRAIRPVRHHIVDFEPDVVQTSLFLGNLVGQIAASPFGIPVVSNLVLSGDEDLLRQYQPGADSWRASLLRKIAGWAARRPGVSFRALTEDVKQTNADLLGVDPAKIAVIPRGVVRTSPPTVTRAQLGLPEQVPLAMNVGRHTAQKGQVDLVRAFAATRRIVPDAHLAIVGREGDASPAIVSEIERNGLGEVVHLIGHTSDLPAYLSVADVFVFPSLMEGLGTVVLEALAAGLPMIAYDIPPVREATDDGRLATLVPVGDVDRLGSELAELLLDPSKQQAGEKSRWVEETHDPDEVASRVEELLMSVIRDGR